MYPQPLVGAENAFEAHVSVGKRVQKLPNSKKVPIKLNFCLLFSPGRRKKAEVRRLMD
jgi:hypothetical protein